MQIDGIINIEGNDRCYFGQGARLSVASGGVLNIGSGFVNTANGTIVCVNKIDIGEHVTISWDTLIMDTDWHRIRNVSTGEVYSRTKPITIGNNTWICLRSVILKGSHIPDGSIVASGSIVSSKFEGMNLLICGVPGKIIRQGVTIHDRDEL